MPSWLTYVFSNIFEGNVQIKQTQINQNNQDDEMSFKVHKKFYPASQ